MSVSETIERLRDIQTPGQILHDLLFPTYSSSGVEKGEYIRYLTRALDQERGSWQAFYDSHWRSLRTSLDSYEDIYVDDPDRLEEGPGDVLADIVGDVLADDRVSLLHRFGQYIPLSTLDTDWDLTDLLDTFVRHYVLDPDFGGYAVIDEMKERVLKRLKKKSKSKSVTKAKRSSTKFKKSL